MASFYTNFSFVIEAKKEAIDLFIRIIAVCVSLLSDSYERDKQPGDDDVVEDVRKVIEEREAWSLGFDLATQGDTQVWIHDDGDNADLELCADLIQLWLSLAGESKSVYFTWADTCNRSAVDAFGGGGCVVTKDAQHWMNTSYFVEKASQGVSLSSPSEMFSMAMLPAGSQMAILDELFSEKPMMKAFLAEKIEAKQSELFGSSVGVS